MMKSLPAILGITLLLVQTAQASGDYTWTWASVQGQACRAARNAHSPVARGKTCGVGIHFAFSACENHQSLTSCFYYLPEGRKVRYWIERRKDSRAPWKRFTQAHVFDRNNIDEYLNITVTQKYQYRVAFDYTGFESYGDEFTDTFSLYVRP